MYLYSCFDTLTCTFTHENRFILILILSGFEYLSKYVLVPMFWHTCTCTHILTYLYLYSWKQINTYINSSRFWVFEWVCTCAHVMTYLPVLVLVRIVFILILILPGFETNRHSGGLTWKRRINVLSTFKHFTYLENWPIKDFQGFFTYTVSSFQLFFLA